MFFHEGCTIVGQLPQQLIDNCRTLALSIDINDSKFRRSEPALRYTNRIVTVPPPITDSMAYNQDNSNIDFTSVKAITDELLTWSTFKNCMVFSCEINYLEPNSWIKKHNDVRFYHLVGRRIQVPLMVDESYFISRDREFNLKTPNVYEIDNITTHWAKNTAETSKISLLIDLLDRDIVMEERALERSLRRRVLYYKYPPEQDLYR